ncbi:hypothetical protein LWI28_004033 [Acer negundo]|uniref:Uncharacterized protein n=1 Tax=Acer negundo TaxID=4023 RepID=A0AAD5NFX2_ACENE|nr:hypothetical protein LWI28_004033 [Acer negundo]
MLEIGAKLDNILIGEVSGTKSGDRGETSGADSALYLNNDYLRDSRAKITSKSVMIESNMDFVFWSGKVKNPGVKGKDLRVESGLTTKVEVGTLGDPINKIDGPVLTISLLRLDMELEKDKDKWPIYISVSRNRSNTSNVLLSDEGIGPVEKTDNGQVCYRSVGSGVGKLKRAARKGPLIGSDGLVGVVGNKRQVTIAKDVFNDESNKPRSDASEVRYEDSLSAGRLSSTH